MLGYSENCKTHRLNMYLSNWLIFPKIKVLSTEPFSV